MCNMFMIIQVDFDEDTAHSMLDRKGFMTRESFFEFAISTKLVDFLEKKEAPTPKKQQMMPPRYTTKVWILHIQYSINDDVCRGPSPRKDYAAVESVLLVRMRRRTEWNMPLERWTETIAASSHGKSLQRFLYQDKRKLLYLKFSSFRKLTF